MKSLNKRLPQKWKEVELGNENYFEILSSGIGKFEGKKDYLSTESVQGTRINKIECEITYDKKPSRANMQPVLNSIWFAKMQATLKVYCFDETNKEEIEEYILSTGFAGIKVNENEVYTKYLKLIFTSKLFNKEKDDLSTGSTQRGINNTFIKKIKIPLPQLQTQKAIVQILEKAEQLKQKREQADKLIDDYLKSVFNEMFYDKGFEEIELGKIANFFMGGTPPSSEINSANADIPWIKGSDLIKEYIFYSNNFITKEGMKKSRARYYSNGTILIGRTGQGKTRAKTAILRFESTTNETVIGIFPEAREILSEYLHFNLKLRYQELRNLAGDNQRGGITQNDLRNLKIPLPPLVLQKKFASIVEKVEKIKEAQKESKQEIEDLFNALMQKAFRGELI